jgi:hypothetical protein
MIIKLIEQAMIGCLSAATRPQKPESSDEK